MQGIRVDPWQEPQALSMPKLPSSGHPHGRNHPGGDQVAADHLVPRSLPGEPGQDRHLLTRSEAPSGRELTHGMAGSKQDHASDDGAGWGLCPAGKGTGGCCLTWRRTLWW